MFDKEHSKLAKGLAKPAQALSKVGRRRFWLGQRPSKSAMRLIRFHELTRNQKRRRAAAVQNAGAMFRGQRQREASWSAPARWSFGRLNREPREQKLLPLAKISRPGSEIGGCCRSPA